MDRETETRYHLQLSHDLILFLMSLQTEGLSQEQKVRRTNMIMETWHQRVEKQIAILNKEHTKELAQQEETADSEDVLAIISSVQSFELIEIRKAFKEIARSNIINSYKTVGR